MAYCGYCGNPLAEVSPAPCPQCGNPSNGAPRRVGAGKSGANTAVIVIAIVAGLFVLVAIVGILAAIAIPNLLTAQGRSSQKRTIADLRSLASALEAHATDHDQYPRADSVAGLASSLSPAYIRDLPTKDGWGHDFKYECWPADACTSFAVGSPGKDGQWERASLQDYASGTATTRFDADIVYADGKFVQYPEATQQP